ncbi:enoyl-CoA hydratase/carnithine racemase [Oceanisphaera litoralis]|uniref:enoyl-CoA hydratase/isomerase family protein n=1 Tax=Oceanisphaera litoralis TaxID=225144 RepID=UPI00195D3F5B|nr:enoyl-CoA hydratase/isomerase family protein [Oceanisphaera litoralis]MBM7455761.1 enoyl-CoA hydratase/carnithine racemase [Oceanisphaera litoralis]
MSGLSIEEYPTGDGKRIGHIRLNAERSLNALTLEMIEQMLPTLTAWQQDPQLVAVLLDGAGDKAFCAGGDVVTLYHAICETGPVDERGLAPVSELAARFFEREYRLDYLLHTFNKPVLCWGGGIVMGGGMGLFSACSHRIVTETSRLAMPEVTIALYPDVGGSWFLNHLPPGLGEFIALTGCAINGKDAHWLGLGNRTLAADKRAELLPALQAVTNWHRPEAAVSAVLRQLEADSGDVFAGLSSPLRQHQPQIRLLLDKDSLANKVAAILGAEYEDSWFQQARQGLAAGSPLAIRVIAEQLRRSRHCSLAEVFRAELALSVQLCRFREFAEGVRARLIDKDNRPDWTFTSLKAVDEGVLAALFESPWPVNPLTSL